MPEFYLVINQEKLHLYQHNHKGFEKEFFDGEPVFPYEASRVKEAVGKLENVLLDNKNLEDKRDLSFIVVLSDDGLLNEAFSKALDGQISRKAEIGPLLRHAINRLARNAWNHIDDFGINYDGRCYKRRGNDLESGRFSLLALTLTPENILDEFLNVQKGGN